MGIDAADLGSKEEVSDLRYSGGLPDILWQQIRRNNRHASNVSQGSDMHKSIVGKSFCVALLNSFLII